ncbi:MAG: dihydroorotate dehydrogenase [Bacteroidetes bacterium GWF2_42_66]|nr:MAG: dihydroorotate dehydrogenase [Bacteroidetes bacterium GWA2_42_15]OFY02159.1 MAG: dihydroorotate dehydrogenase [Bacteroidetes bacterium GWE2_42_39]OFY43605.1 MAG: dihydroorotate dehydrogenase [Bacteroidetes bacterium GWF2_42_66]HBL75235.1 dihydroorotate dehydrogenase [Prolixibacteraceae bacterium]HCR92288.1 dihydroorotate dehydrogenase [Prolixibacteraceae bacterium]
MANLSTSYMGVKLKNPLILGASNLVSKPETIARIVEAGIGAIVYKSLFEEQIQLESLQLEEEMTEYENRNAEMTRLFPSLEHAGPKEHLFNLKKLKESVSVPVFASLNAIYEPSWVDYARQLEGTGVDGLEINLYSTPGYFEISGNSIEEKQLQIVKSIKKAVKIPVSVKLSPFYTNALNFINKLDEAGADGYVLFNKFFQPEIDIQEELFYYPWELTNGQDHQLALRYAGLLHGNINGSICASRGIQTTEDMIRLLLAGADVVQMVSAIYQYQAKHVAVVLEGLSAWMDKKGYKTIDEFKGKLSRKNLKDPYSYQRAQYVDILMNSEEIFKKYPMV